MKWFRVFKSPGESLAVSMAGIKLGDRLLMLGCGDPLLMAQLAVKTGLTGRAFALDEEEALTSEAAKVAAREGALIETASALWTSLPLDANAFDVAVLRNVLPGLDVARRAACAREVRRVLRPGGRCLLIDSVPGRGLAGLVRRTTAPHDYTAHDAVRVLEGEAFRAARVLAERDGLVFVEAVRGNTNASDDLQ